MRNIIGLLVIGASTISSLEARDNVYIGLEFGLAKQTWDVSKPNTGNETAKQTYKTLKIGKYFDNQRVSLNFDSSSNIGVNHDYLFTFEDSKFTPYLGTGLYYTKSNYEYSKSSGIFIPLVIGSIYKLDKDFDLEFGVRYIIDTYEYTSSTLQYKSESQTNYFVAINYNF